MHIGILTGGGDCPGLNAVIRAVTLALIEGCGARVTGIERGFLGLLEDKCRPLDAQTVRGLVAEGGTVLGTHNRADPFHYFGAGGSDCSGRALDFLGRHSIDALVAIGGDGTMTIAERFARLGVPVIGVPKTIDNDLACNERSFGFDSAVAVVSEALGRLETTARSHGRVMIVETMGRYAGWIALEGGLAGGADAILLPEHPYQPETLAAFCRRRLAEQGYALICLAEGAHAIGAELTVQQHIEASPDPLRLGGVSQLLLRQLEGQLGAEVEVRHTLLGHVQRGGSPTAFDRVLATRFGVAAASLVMRKQFGRMVALQGDRCVDVGLADVAGRNRLVPQDHELMLAARDLGVCLG
ncbi:ATP-dependent 6-phosphofructokinase [Paucibacter sp. APW11]|uniref:ATP-dependent 6-phosphofructokinase n=1 Tax=Roseateles aquae TaxID=3077235 RepID=A0ABU3P6C6_9BURK|nr:ATP-dependent 6-phosphofructokinase [Paucibacter sp. APW11]MDT8998118.1 ATP-dependent 6-phosphofructokinase [Paucibacter sp. APW11]